MGQFLLIKVIEGDPPKVTYKNKTNLRDPEQLCLVLGDIETIYHAPVKSACKKFLDRKGKMFPI